jgi:transcriptional regulator with XRE-family HTH domain
MKLSNFLFKTHRLIEIQESRKITQADMAKRLGISHRTYVEYRRSTEPIAAIVILDVLSSLDWEDAKKLLEQWKCNETQRDSK